jgi:hypothetical protein
MKLTIDKTYHPEYGGHVYQPRVDGESHNFGFWIEPFVTEKEAKAFLRGVSHGVKLGEAKLEALEKAARNAVKMFVDGSVEEEDEAMLALEKLLPLEVKDG